MRRHGRFDVLNQAFLPGVRGDVTAQLCMALGRQMGTPQRAFGSPGQPPRDQAVERNKVIVPTGESMICGKPERGRDHSI